MENAKTVYVLWGGTNGTYRADLFEGLSDPLGNELVYQAGLAWDEAPVGDRPQCLGDIAMTAEEAIAVMSKEGLSQQEINLVLSGGIINRFT